MASKRSPKTTTAAQRALEAVRLRDEGMGFEEIGTALGISRQGATKAYDRGMALLEDETKELARHIRAAEARKLDRIERGLIATGAFQGNVPVALAALKVQERRAKLLGLDAPTKAELTGKDGAPIGPAATFAVPLSALPQEDWVRLAQSFAAAGEEQVNALLKAPTDGSDGQ